MLFNNEDNNSSGNKGNKGKFSERLKKMRRDRFRIRKYGSLENEDEIPLITGIRNIFKVVLALPSVIYTHISNVDKTDIEKKVNELLEDEELLTSVDMTDMQNILNDVDKYSERKKIKVNKIKELDVNSLKKKKEYLLNISNNKFRNIAKVVGREEINLELDDKKKKLQKEIVDLIKKKLVKNINELEILQSELYVLNELKKDDIYLSECQEDIKQIKKLLSKIKTIKEKYDYLKDDVDFQYMLEYSDDLLIDKILELKDMCLRDDIKNVVDDYKLLEEYKFLYIEIDKLQDDMIKLEDYKIKKAEELKERDIEFDKLKDDMYDIDRENERYNRFVKEQESMLSELDDKLLKIDSYEEVTYKLKGFNKLLGNSFKYLGLLMLNPLKGLIPGIATQTLITKNVIHNLYNNLEWQENRRMVYEAIDYSNSINIAINNLDDTASLVDSTLEELIMLKKKYQSEFKKYEGSFSSYKDAIKKLNKIENAVLGSKIKIDMMRIKMDEKKKLNDSKLKKVKNLNSNSNN